MSEKPEIWRDISGYEGLYQISNRGNIRSVERLVPRSGFHFRHKGLNRIPGINNRGYYSITLCKNAKYRHFVIHRLVAEAFISNPENKLFINHKDGNKLNNDFGNLEWVTMSENNKHAYNSGLKVGSFTGIKGADNPFSRPVLMLDINTGNVIDEFPGIHEAARKLGLKATNICAALNGRTSSCGGYRWIRKTKNKVA